MTADAIQEAFDEAVKRGRMTRPDAAEHGGGLISRGRRQAEEFLAEVERLLGPRRAETESATVDTRAAPGGRGRPRACARSTGRAAPRHRPGFPIIGYDDLTAAQITTRLSDLSPAELRKVRDSRAPQRQPQVGAAGDREEAR